MADVEGWNQKKIVHYFNNMQAFEKFYANVSSNMPATGTPHHEDFNCKSDPSCFVLAVVAEKVAGYRGSDSELRQALDGGFSLACRSESPGRACERRA